MSSLGYDEALLNKIKRWIRDDSLNIIGPSQAKDFFSYKADINNDKPIQLPTIVIRRLSPITVINTNRKPLSFDGAKDVINKDKGAQLNAIPIQLNYQLDIYTRYFEESDEYIRNFIFNLINYPKVEIEIPYNNSNIKHESAIRISPDIEDNSDIPERLFEGQFTRRTISIYIDDAYLFDYKPRDVIRIENTDVEIKLKTEINDD